jgi:hypothetical protein
MDAPELKRALVFHFSPDEVEENAVFGCDLAIKKGDVKWAFVLCPDKQDGDGYLGAFEAAMQRVVDARQNGQADLQLGMAVAFASTAHGQSPSYRRALKKYSNSIVFEDLGLHLFLVTGEKAVDVLRPSEVNAFMRDLDRWILDRKKS